MNSRLQPDRPPGCALPDIRFCHLARQKILMNQNLHAFPAGAVEQAVFVERNRVLRNTYGRLAPSMVSTVLGAWAGIATGSDGQACSIFAF